METNDIREITKKYLANGKKTQEVGIDFVNVREKIKMNDICI